MKLIKITISYLAFAAGLAACSGSSGGGEGLGGSSNDVPNPITPPVENAAFPRAFDQSAVYTRDIFVSPAGSDTSGNGSENSPFATVARALQNRTAGTRVIMAAGQYPAQGTFSNLVGTAQNPIAIVGRKNKPVPRESTRFYERE